MLITSSNAEWWLHVPTLGTVTVRDAHVELPYLQCTRSSNLQGDPSVKLESYKADAPFTVDPTVDRRGDPRRTSPFRPPWLLEPYWKVSSADDLLADAPLGAATPRSRSATATTSKT